MDDMTRRTFMQASATAAAAAALAPSAEGEDNPQTADAGFEAGAAVRDITPAPGVVMWGYSDRSGPATGTLDPLHARAVVFRAGGKTAALVTLDLGRVPMPPSCDRIRARAAEAGVQHVMFCASHTHHAPMMELEDEPHAASIEQGIGDAIEEAASRLQPARIGVGRTRFDIAHNRRFIREGKCYMLWRNEERRPTSPLDPEAGVIRIDRADGTPLAVLVNFACHPVVMGPSNLQYSADWCGEMARIVKEKTGAECLFLQGGCGDINPYLDKTPIDEGGVDAMRSVGRTCADAVVALLGTLEPSAPERPSVAVGETRVAVGTRWDLSDPQVQAYFRAMYASLFDKYLKNLPPDLTVPLAALVLNRNLAFAFMPGELFIQHQIDLKRGSPVRDTFLCGYSNDFHLYFPTVKDAALGGYGGSVATYVGLGAGAKLVTAAEIEIGRLTGDLRPAPIESDFKLVDYEEG